MNKLNFDLKLEIFHRTQQMNALEKKLERMKEMEGKVQRMHKLEEEVQGLRAAEKDHRVLRESNDQLRQELGKRDQAVTEAVQLICQLEAKIDELETGDLKYQLSMSRLVLDGPNATKLKIEGPAEAPQQTSPRLRTSNSQGSHPNLAELRQISKAPSFLRADNQSTATLRSLYAPENNKSHTTLSELTKSTSLHTMNDTLEPQSPRLSVLSEASELNTCDTPSKRNEFDKLDIPIRQTPSTESLDSYIPPSERKSQESEHINQWLQSRPDMSGTIIRRRQNRKPSDASKTESSTSTGELHSKKSHERQCPEASFFGGARLPPTPDTMSTAYAAVNNGSSGSIAAQKSPESNREQWFAGRPLNRHRSADELKSQRSFRSDITDSMQTNCSDTPRLGVKDEESPTIFPFNTVAPKASELLGPGSPNNPAINSYGDVLNQDSKCKAAPPTTRPERTPAKCTLSHSRSTETVSSPPLTPQDWLAAASRAPQSRQEQSHRSQPDLEETEPIYNVISQASFHDDQSIDSFRTESDGPGIPTMDMNTLDILEHPVAEPLAKLTGPREFEPMPEPQRRRFSLRPSFLNRSNGPRHLQSSPIGPNDIYVEDEGAPPPVVRKHKNASGSQRRPMSQIITDSADLYSNNQFQSNAHYNDTTDYTFQPKSFHQSFTETKLSHLSSNQSPATISGRPSTSHSMDHKARRSSLGILGWMKNVSGKRSEPVTHAVEPDADAAHLKEQRGRLVNDRPVTGSGSASGSTFPRPGTPDSMDPPHSEISMYTDDSARRPRYMGRRVRRG